jgi:hypothetical protein
MMAVSDMIIILVLDMLLVSLASMLMLRQARIKGI